MADKPRQKPTKKSTKKPVKKTAKSGTTQPVLLSGGNPQIAKGQGDAPVQAYIAAMPGWKQAVGRRLDALIVQTIPGVHKAVKWNTPLYAVNAPSERGVGEWFLGFHCITKYIKVAFFRGSSLSPVPPVASKQKEVRYLHIHEDEAFDEAQFVAWVKQAGALPGEKM